MRDARKLVFLLWTVIVVLIIGSGIGGFLLVRKVEELNQSNYELTGSNDSLRNQLKQAKASPSPSATPLTSASPSPSAAPAVSPSATPAPTVTAQPHL